MKIKALDRDRKRKNARKMRVHGRSVFTIQSILKKRADAASTSKA